MNIHTDIDVFKNHRILISTLFDLHKITITSINYKDNNLDIYGYFTFEKALSSLNFMYDDTLHGDIMFYIHNNEVTLNSTNEALYERVINNSYICGAIYTLICTPLAILLRAIDNKQLKEDNYAVTDDFLIGYKKISRTI